MAMQIPVAAPRPKSSTTRLLSTPTPQVPTGKYWYNQWVNETDPGRKARLDKSYGFTAKYGAQAAPQAQTVNDGLAQTVGATAPAAAAAPAPAADAQPPYFNYTVPGHGRTTQALKDTAGDTWYKTQGGKWRNVRTQMVQTSLPAWQAAPAPAPAAPAPAAEPAAQPPAVTPVQPLSNRQFVGANEDPFAATAVPNDGYDQAFYDWQKEQGIKGLEAFLSKQGLTSSGAAGQLGSDMLSRLGAEEALRRQQMTEAQRNRQFTASESSKGRQLDTASIDADRAWNAQQLEQERRYRSGNTQWTRIMNVLDRILSLNPMQYAANATSESAQYQAKLGEMLAGLETAMGGGGGGGGGGGAPPVRPPNYTGAQTDYSNSQDWAGLVGNILGSPLINNLLYG